MTRNALILLSGGLDSLCCAHFMIKQGFDVTSIFVDFGQAAVENERASFSNLVSYFDLKHVELKFESPKDYGSGEIRGRNLFLYAAAVSGAPVEAGLICSGIHKGTSYYDCSEMFLKTTSKMITEMTDGRFDAIAPFVTWNKNQIYEYALANNLPIALTYSCESNAKTQCGECLSCLDRLQLFNSPNGDN